MAASRWVLLFLHKGWLSSLEVYSCHEPIRRFPSTERLALGPVHGDNG